MAGIRTSYLDEEDAERLYAAYPDLKGSPDTYCPTCSKTGFYFWRGEIHECDCEYQLQLFKHYLHTQIGETYQRLDWDDYEGSDRHHAETLIDYINNPMYVRRGMGVFLSGPKGTGKTMMAHLTLKEFVKHGYSCYATLFTDAIELFTAGWRSNEDKAYFVRRFQGSQILLLDDVAKEYRTRLSESVLDGILRQRVQAGKPTIITTNVTEGELSQEYGSGVLSLLREKSLAFLYFDGEDFRTRANDREKEEIANGEVRPLI